MPLYKNIQNYGLLVTNNAGDVAAVSSHSGGAGTIHVIPATGYTDGVDDASVITDADFVSGNILSGVNIFGIDGSATAAVPLTGDAAVTDVLATKTFYNTDQATKETGTMTNRAGDTAAVSTHAGASTEIHAVAAAGYYDGSDDAVVLTDADFVANNIGLGVNIFGVTGIGIIDSYTKVLLHMDGSNNGTTFTDQSGKSWTAAGTAVTSTGGKAYGSASLLCDGNSDYIYTSDSDDFYFGTDPWTIDFWINPTSITATTHGICGQYQDANNVFFITSNGATLYFELIASAAYVFSYYVASAFSAGVWTHIAIVRNGSTMYLFKNGVSQSITTQTAIGASSCPNLSGNFTVGWEQVMNRYLYGYIDEFRISKGIARWTANFVPGAPYGG